MKIILKLLCAPIIVALWIITAICNLLLKVSSIVLAFAAILFAIASVLKIIDGHTTSGLFGLGVAFLFSPYGLPTLAALLLARLYCLRYWLQEVVYSPETYR